jgi:hypothetical protein
MREIAHNWISSVRIKVNASRIAAATASAAQSEDRSANQKTTFFDSIDPLRKFGSGLAAGQSGERSCGGEADLRAPDLGFRNSGLAHHHHDAATVRRHANDPRGFDDLFR